MSNTFRSSQNPTPLRIFLVEDSDDTREFMRAWLRQLGHVVFEAATVRDALLGIPLADCDVLISDIELPDANGWELLERLRAQRPLYAIAVTARGASADLARSRAAGYRHHLVKPYDPEDLLAILRRAARELAEAEAEAAH